MHRLVRRVTLIGAGDRARGESRPVPPGPVRLSVGSDPDCHDIQYRRIGLARLHPGRCRKGAERAQVLLGTTLPLPNEGSNKNAVVVPGASGGSRKPGTSPGAPTGSPNVVSVSTPSALAGSSTPGRYPRLRPRCRCPCHDLDAEQPDERDLSRPKPGLIAETVVSRVFAFGLFFPMAKGRPCKLWRMVSSAETRAGPRP